MTGWPTAARERERRRVERELAGGAWQRRRETRDALGDRVKDWLKPVRRRRSTPRRRRRGCRARGDVYWRRRLSPWALVAAAALVVASRGGDPRAQERRRDPGRDRGPPAKTVTIPEGYDRSQIAEIAKQAGLRGDYLKASQSFKGFDPAEYGAESPESLEGFLFPATYELPPPSDRRRPGRTPAGGLQAERLRR